MKIWITGISGQVGRALQDVLERHGIDHFGTTHAEVDIADSEQVRPYIDRATHIINAAALAQVDVAETERDRAFRANALGPENLAKQAQGKARLIHISTDYVFDGRLRRPYREEDETNPLNWYGQTKLEGELRILTHMPDACIIRPSWVFGGEGRNYASLMLDLMRQRTELRIVNDQIGRPTYAFDLAEALIAMRDESGIYHYANHGSLSKYAFARAIWESAKQKGIPMACERILPIHASAYPTPAVRPLYTPFDTSKIEQKLTIRPWREALAEYFEEKRVQKPVAI